MTHGYYPLLSVIIILSSAWIANTVVKNVTARNMMIIIPTLTLLLGLGLRSLPRIATLIIIGILLLGAPENLIPSDLSNGPYREIVQSMATTYQTDSILITHFDSAWQWLMPAAYTLMDFAPIEMSKYRMLHLIDPNDRAYTPSPPDRLVNVYKTITPQQLDAFAQEYAQLWVLREHDGNNHTDMLDKWLRANYTKSQQFQWTDELYPTSYTLTEFYRVPEGSQLILSADDTLQLFAWSLQDSVEVTACQAITLESWWQTTQTTDTPQQLNLILADENGQIAIAENFPSHTYTTDWESEIYYRDQITLTIPCDIATGNYNLLLGVKDSITGKPSLLTYPDGNTIGTLYYLTTLNAQGN